MGRELVRRQESSGFTFNTKGNPSRSFPVQLPVRLNFVPPRDAALVRENEDEDEDDGSNGETKAGHKIFKSPRLIRSSSVMMDRWGQDIPEGGAIPIRFINSSPSSTLSELIRSPSSVQSCRVSSAAVEASRPSLS